MLIWQRLVRNKIALWGAAMLALMVVAVLAAPLITGLSATSNPAIDTHITDAFQPPSLAHPLGTDEVGRDELARLLFGARTSLFIGLGAMVVAVIIGTSIGLTAGYFGGVWDSVVMRVTDAIIAVPIILILFVLSASFSSSSVPGIIALLGALSWPNIARIVRGEVLSLKEREFVLAARTLGARNWRLIILHILPNASTSIIVSATLLVGNSILAESTLSFFNLGIQPPAASWGSMLATGQTYVFRDQMLVILPGLAILLTVLSFNLLGDGLRDALDVRSTQR